MKSDAKGLPRSRIIFAALFVGSLLLFETVFLESGENLRTLSRIFARDGLFPASIALLAYLTTVIVTFSFVLAAASTWKFARPVYFLVFAFVTSIEYSVYSAFGGFSTPHLTEIAFWAADWRIIHDAVGIYINPWSAVPILVFGTMLFATSARPTFHRRSLIAFTAISAGFFFLTSYFSSNSYPAISFSAGVRTAVSFPTIWLVGTSDLDPKNPYYLAERETVTQISTDSPANNVVFIMDESVRGDYLSINGYPVKTTPTLERLNTAGHLRNWGIASSGATCSAPANNLVLTGLIDLPDPSFDVYRRPTIFQYAKAMNYKTYLIDAQASGVWLGKPSDFEYIDEWIRASELIESAAGLYDIDGAAADRVNLITETSTGNFIWVIKFGVHRPYEASYPDPEQNSPGREPLIGLESTQAGPLQASYVKAIHYNSEIFFSRLFEGDPVSPTFYLYTSDHGQNLGESEWAASHCVPTRETAMVPLLLIANREQMPPGDSNYLASHENIFPTLLDLLGVPQGERLHSYAFSLLSAVASDSRKRYFFSGDLHGDGRRYPFDP